MPDSIIVRNLHSKHFNEFTIERFSFKNSALSFMRDERKSTASIRKFCLQQHYFPVLSPYFLIFLQRVVVLMFMAAATRLRLF